MDRFDLRIDVPPVAYTDLDLPASGRSSEEISQRVAQARKIQTERYAEVEDVRVNADVEGEYLKEVTALDTEGAALLARAAEHYHVAEAVSYRVAS